MNRPTRHTLFGAVLCVAVAVFYGCRARAAGTDQDFDMACAVTAAAEIATHGEGSTERSTAFMVSMYFLGRLSGRDGRTYWSAVVKGRVAELREKSKSEETYGRCLDFLSKQL